MAIKAQQRSQLEAIRARHRNALAEGVRMAKETGVEPAATAGALAEGFPVWEPGRTYALNEMFRHDGMLGFSRQEGLTAQAAYPPFSAGTEALYGVRPCPDEDGVYPYVYNMAAVAGMRVKDGGKTYVCIQAANPLLYAPGDAPALFREEDAE